MSWNTLTDQMVMSRFTTRERAALQAVAADDTQLTTVLTDVVATIRGNIIAGGNRLGADGTIPDQLKVHALSMAIWQWLSGFPKNERLQTAGREKNYDTAIDILGDIAAGKIKVELPAADEVQDTAGPTGQIRKVSGNTRRFKRRQTDGL